MKKLVCAVCGYIHVGETAPEKCPICQAAASKFSEMSTDALSFADEHKIGVAKDCNPELVESLRYEFLAECAEIGMYLAMSRQAYREGYAEVAEVYKTVAVEEADHAARYAEMLGEIVDVSTKKNLEARMMAEHGANQCKLDLAKKAKERGLDAIHDSVHEMCKDEARHGMVFRGLFERYFK